LTDSIDYGPNLLEKLTFHDQAVQSKAHATAATRCLGRKSDFELREFFSVPLLGRSPRLPES
jgi:hypothetical protein